MSSSVRTLALSSLSLILLGLLPAPATAAPETLTPCAAEPTNMLLAYGSVVECAISPSGDSDLFRFPGSANEVAVLSLLSTAGGTAKADVFPPGFKPGVTPPLATLGPGNASLEVTLPTTGTYTIRVAEDGNNETMTYRVGVERLFPASPTAQPLCFGCALTAETIDPRPDQDFYTFDGAQDAYVTLTLTDGTGGCRAWQGYPCPSVRLFGPDQTLVDTLGPGTQSKDIALPLDGTYTVRVFEDGNNQNETYNLSLECVFPPAGQDTCDYNPEPPVPKCNGLTATIVGTEGPDSLIGTAGDDVIVGLGGNDYIPGGSGNDTICGGAGADILRGGPGDDRLFGEAGADVLIGETGADSLNGGDGQDTLLGNADDDVLTGDAGNDVLIGGGGMDAMNGGLGRDVCDKDAQDLPAPTGCEVKIAP